MTTKRLKYRLARVWDNQYSSQTILSRTSVLIPILIAGFFSSAIRLTAQEQASTFASGRSIVAQLRIHRSTTDETAAAVLVGWNEDRVYFVTAYHAISTPIGVTDDHGSIELQLFGQPSPVPASSFSRFDAANDMGVVSIPVPKSFRPPPVIDQATPRLGFRVQLVGHPSSGEWGVLEAEVQNENGPGTEASRFVYVGQSAPVPGFSGGPVLDSAGRFLGIHLETRIPYGVGLKSDDIIRQLNAWHIPVNAFAIDIVNQVDILAIRSTLTQYELAYSRRDSRMVHSLFPQLNQRMLDAQFRDLVTVKQVFDIDRVHLGSDQQTAVVTGVLTSTVQGVVGPLRISRSVAVASMFKQGVDWLIKQIDLTPMK